MQRLLILFGTLAALLMTALPSHAQRFRLHATGAGAMPVGGYQKDEFGFGGAALLAGELAIIEQLGVQLEVGGIWLTEGDPPADPTIQPEGAASAYFAGLGLHARPFAPGPEDDWNAASGIWAAANAAVTTTGSRTRALVDAYLGYDFILADGRYGLGPVLGLTHVFQANDALRPEDANILTFGLHFMLDRPRKATGVSDRDGDGIPDAVDQCPDDPEDKDGFEDEDGCPELDNDGDGIPDGKDACPMVPEDKDGFQDEDGCPDEDNDQDGILDKDDACPDDPEDMDGFEDEDGCPDPDNDQDGILDAQDLCPNEPETKNDYADHDGCPDEELVRVVGKKIVLDDRVHFRTNNWTIRVVSFPLLERLAKLLREHPEYVHIEIQGHTDRRGDRAFNQKLSEDRAASVQTFLVEHGVDEDRLSSVGFGPDRPLRDENTERAWFMNRRVEFEITRETEQVVRRGGPGAPPVTPDAAEPGETEPGAGTDGASGGEETTPEGEPPENVEESLDSDAGEGDI